MHSNELMKNPSISDAIKQHRAVGIIPARGGSKRVPRKNVYPIEGKPMIVHVIEAALEAGVFERIIVSSDDDEILKVSLSSGAEPYSRPASLADDMTHVGPVVEDVVRAMALLVDSVCLLYATAVLLRPADLRAAFSELVRPEVHSVLSITEFDAPIQRAYEMNSNGQIRMALPEYFNWRSQDLPKRFRDAAMFSWTKTAAPPKNTDSESSDEDRHWPQRVGYLIPKTRAVDIDTPEDLVLAQALFSHHKAHGAGIDGPS
jgi:N-acylneuraminate cytidylyltransferase